MECVRRAVAVEVENPPSELYAVEEQYRRIVEEVAAYVAERGRLETRYLHVRLLLLWDAVLAPRRAPQ
jgi:hypothetical protein